MKKIRFMDTSFRDGFQSVIGARVIVDDFLPALKAAVEAGIMHLEVGGGARFQSPYFYCGEDGFECMDKIRAAVGPEPNLQTLARGVNVVGLTSQSSEMIDLHAKLFKKHGMTTIRNFDALNDIRNMAYSGECIYKAGLFHQATITMMSLPPGMKDTYPHSAEFYASILKNILESGMHFHSLCFKDASGTCTPAVIREAVRRCREMLDAAGMKDVPIEMHTHDTADMAVACYMAAIEGGAEIIDLAMRPMSGGTSQPDLLTMWHAFKHTDYTLDIDYEKILKVEDTFEKCMAKYMLPPEAKTTNPLVTLSPLPGGALTANTQMMRDNNCLDLFPAVVRNMREVVEKGGFGTSVTPVSQFYFQQAFANTMDEKAGKPLWSTITPGYGRMVLGYFGRTPSTPDPEIVKKAAAVLKLEPTTEDAREIRDRDPKFNRPYYEQVLKDNNLPVNDENVFIIACCEDKGLAFLKGDRPMGCRFVTDTKKETKKETPKEQPKMSNNAPAAYTILVNGKAYQVQVLPGGMPMVTNVMPAPVAAAPVAAAKPASGTEVKAPMPATVKNVAVNVGDAVKKGDTLIVVEAMKMEQSITAPADGTVQEILVAVGDKVDPDQVVAII
ncbi:MAG: hypothetical protein IJJ26_01435 [Victivallales bacterium]|nr:hypothetical protein [Victivallales bacterium]